MWVEFLIHCLLPDIQIKPHLTAIPQTKFLQAHWGTNVGAGGAAPESANCLDEKESRPSLYVLTLLSEFIEGEQCLNCDWFLFKITTFLFIPLTYQGKKNK